MGVTLRNCVCVGALCAACVVLQCIAVPSSKSAGTTTILSVHNSQFLSKPSCCWQCIKQPGCVDELDQGRASDMLRENVWASSSRKQLCTPSTKCPKQLRGSFPSNTKQFVFQPYTTNVVSNPKSKVMLSKKQLICKKFSELTIQRADVAVSSALLSFEGNNWFNLQAARCTLDSSNIKGQLQLVALKTTRFDLLSSSMGLINTRMSLDQQSSLNLQHSSLIYVWRRRKPAPIGPYTLGSSTPFTSVDSTIRIKYGTIRFENVTDVFLIRTRVTIDNAELVIINSNVRLISCTLALNTASIRLVNSRLLLSSTTVATDRYVATVSGALALPKPRWPFADLSTIPFYASGKGRIAIKSIRE